MLFRSDGRKNVTAKTYFWVIPTGPLVATLGTLAFIVLLMAWFIRRYIRRAMELERARLKIDPSLDLKESALKTLLEPIREGVVDLRAARGVAPPSKAVENIRLPTIEQRVKTRGEFFAKYRLFFSFVALVVVSTMIAWWYFERALVQHRAYKIQAISSEIEEPLK